MGPEILVIAVVAIISGTIVKLRRLQIEKEHLGLRKSPLMSKRNGKRNTVELEEINRRLENLETIIAAGDLSTLPEAGEGKEMKEQIKLLARRVSELEHERYKDDPY